MRWKKVEVQNKLTKVRHWQSKPRVDEYASTDCTAADRNNREFEYWTRRYRGWPDS